MSSVSITLIVKGTLASELRTRFWPTRFTYSVMTGSLIILAPCSTCCEYCRPIATCLSSEYQLPSPLLQPTLRLPIESMFFIASGEGLFLSPLSGAYCPSEEEVSEPELWAGGVWAVEVCVEE